MSEISASDPDATASVEEKPRLNILSQYIKSLTFENLFSPSPAAKNEVPPVSLNLNVDTNKLSDTEYEVALSISAQAGSNDNAIFRLNLIYGGVFRLQNIPPDALNALVAIECPRLIFPFARQIVADATRNAGFPPLMIDPIDFASLYRQKTGETSGGEVAN